ncbi:hypothetical protein J6T66_04565 [bacterium]|nr:hypothetical protein [bacterium]
MLETNETTQDSSAMPQNDEDTQEDENSDDDSDEDAELESELIISEVYYDGKDERIEIYNI